MVRAMTERSTVPTIPAFVARCDAFCAAKGRGRVWLSKRLFNDTNRLQKLADGTAADIGVRVMERAVADLAALERKEPDVAAA